MGDLVFKGHSEIQTETKLILVPQALDECKTLRCECSQHGEANGGSVKNVAKSGAISD